MQLTFSTRHKKTMQVFSSKSIYKFYLTVILDYFKNLYNNLIIKLQV